MKLFLPVMFIISFLFSCNTESGHELPEGVQNISGTDTVLNRYAEAFTIIEHSDYTEIQITNPDNNAIEFTYSVGKEVKGKTFVKKELSRVAALSSTHLGMMAELNLLNKIVGISDGKFVCSELLRNKVEEGKIAEVGDIGMSDVEGFIAAGPDIIIYSGFNTKAPILQKLNAAGLTTFTNYDWKETHPLGRAEWLKVFGVLFDKRVEATELFNEIESRYLELVKKLKDSTKNPTVLAGTIYGDVFNAPAGDSYMAKVLEDANVDYRYANTEGTGSLTLSLERVISENRDTDVWLNVAATTKKDVLALNQKFDLLKAFRNNQIYSYYQNVNCFWEQSAVRPDVLLIDMGVIFHPELFSSVALKYYRPVN